jgi:hypothetical protein
MDRLEKKQEENLVKLNTSVNLEKYIPKDYIPLDIIG